MPDTATVLACPACAQSLRVPATGNRLRITCPHCQHRYDHAPVSNTVTGQPSAEETADEETESTGWLELIIFIAAISGGVLLASAHPIPQTNHFGGWALAGLGLFLSFALLAYLQERFLKGAMAKTAGHVAGFAHLMLLAAFSWSWAGSAFESRSQPWETLTSWYSPAPMPVAETEQTADTDQSGKALQQVMKRGQEILDGKRPFPQMTAETTPENQQTKKTSRTQQSEETANQAWCRENRTELNSLREQVETANRELPGRQSHVEAGIREAQQRLRIIEQLQAQGQNMNEAVTDHNRKRKRLHAERDAYNRENELNESRIQGYNLRLSVFNRRCNQT